MKITQLELPKIIIICFLLGMFSLCANQVRCEKKYFNRVSIDKEKLLDDYLKGSDIYKAWIDVANHQNYRLVSSEDRMMPSWVSKNKDVFRHIGELTGVFCMGGEVCGTYESNNGVFLLVDKTIANSKKFSLLIIYKSMDTTYKIQWLAKNEDLSNTLLSKNSGNILVEKYYNDGTDEISRICWSKRNSKFVLIK